MATITIPTHLREALCIFDEKGEIEAGRFSHIDNLRAQLSSTQDSIKQTLNALLARDSLAPYLVDKQIHLLYDAQTLLLKAGYSRALKGSVLERTAGGFFYVLPNEIARLYDKQSELRDLYALEVRKLCESLSDIARGELRFLQFLDRQFDVVDLLCGRVGFAKDLGLEFVATVKDSALGSQGRVGFWAKNGDCCGEPAVTHAQVRAFDSPCKAPFLAQKSCREQTELESTFSKVDSSPKAESPQARASLDSSKSLSDSKILDEKCGLQGKSQGSYLDGNDCRDFSQLPHLSSKAQSPQVDSTFLPFVLDSSSTRISSLKGGQGGYLRSVPPLSPFDPPIPLHAFKVARKRATIDCIDSASAESMDCHALPSDKARNDDKNGISKKVDSRENAQNIENSAKDSRENAKILNTPQNEKVESVFDSDSQAAKPTPKQKVDSRENAQNIENSAKDSRNFAHNAPILSDSQAAGFCVFYPNAASEKVDSRENAQNASESAKDSRNFAHNAPILSDSQAAGFADDFWGFQAVGEGIYLGDNEQAHRAESPKSAAKPTPETKKAESSSKTIILNNFCHPILKTPKPISLTFDKGLLLLTGVNAGGKTMLLKSILSAAFLAKLLLPMKINPHKSQIPHYKHIYAIISNPQSSKDDISTFAGRVLEFSQQLDKEDLLLGIDEIELGTDADEAASLYKVLLELLLDRHSKLVVTTHHKRLAALMAKDPRIQLAAAMFDVEQSSATYTFLHGSIGKSYAFEIAQKFGIPKHIIARAKEHYGSDKERLNALIEHSSSLSLELESKAQELQKRIQKARNAKEAYSEKIDALERAYKARERELESTFEKALQALKAQANTQQDLHRNFNQAHEILRHKPKLDSSVKQSQVRKEFKAGDLARYGEQNARVIRTQKGHCVIELDSGMRLKVEKSALAPLSKALASTITKARNAAKTTLSYTPKASVKLDLHGLRAEEALEKLGDFISDSLVAGFDEVLIYHGIGTGVLSAVVKDFLQNHPKVVSFSDAPPNMGGYGAKLVRL